MANPPSIAAKFDDLFRKALTDTEGQRPQSVKEKEHDYYALTTNFLNKLTSTEEIDTCIDRYFALYRSYTPDDPRSKMIFAILLTRRITQTTDDVAWLQDLAKTLDEKQRTSSPIRARFDQLGDNEKQQIRGSLLKALREQETILDELKQAWTSTHKGKKVTIDELYKFDPLPDPALQAAHQAAADKCRKAWDECTKKLDNDTWDRFTIVFREYLEFLKELAKESLKLFQILKWCREPLVGKKVPEGKGKQQRTELHRAPADDLNEQFYLQTAFALFLRAGSVKQLKRNARGFTPSEEDFFFQPLFRTFYFSNYVNHYLFGAKKDSRQFGDISLWHLWLIQFGKLHNVTLVSHKTFTDIVKLYDAVVDIAKKGAKGKEKSKEKGKGQGKHISTKGKATWEYAKDHFNIKQKIGVGANQFEIIYFEKEDTGHPDIYIEYKQVRGTIYRMDINTYISRVESHPYQIIMKNTASLYQLIIQFWGFIFTMFFPGIGYFQLFFRQGFLGVFGQFLIDYQIDFILETLSRVKGAGGPGFGSNMFPWLSILSGKKAFIRGVEREAMGKGKAEAQKLITAEENETSRFGESQLGNRGIAGKTGEEEVKRGWKPLPVKGEVREAERLAGEQAAAEFRRTRGIPEPPRPLTTAEQARANFQNNMERLRTPEVRKSKGEGWTMAEEYDQELVEAVKKERAANTDLSADSFGSNIAAYRVRINGREEIFTASNIPRGTNIRPGFHSEALLERQLQEIAAQLDALKGEAAAARGQRLRFRDDIEVLAIYSERQPCSAHFCRDLIAKEFPNAKVYFSLPEHKVHKTAEEILDTRSKELRDAWLGQAPKVPPAPPTKAPPVPPPPPKPKPKK